MTKKFLLTWAQNATPVHDAFWNNLMVYAKHLGAQLWVMPGKYHNNTNPFVPDNEDHDWWDEKVMPYLVAERVNSRHGDITVAFDVPIVPTASRPLTGFYGFGGANTCVFGHPRYHHETLPVGGQKYPKFLTTTGACTVPNYTKSKLGAKAAFHHIIGFAIIERDGEYYHLRHVNAKASDGSFIDLDVMVQDATIRAAPPAQALTVGDAHAAEQYEPAIVATEQMRDALKPERIIGHDVYTHRARSHHSRDWRSMLTTHRENPNVRVELDEAHELIERLQFTDIMNSNHHQHLERWIDEEDGRFDPVNAETWAELLWMRAHDSADTSLFALDHRWWRRRVIAPLRCIRFWKRGESCKVGDVVQDHGHEGLHGSRGSNTGWQKFGAKVTTAHTHIPRALDGHYTAGHISDPEKHSYSDNTKSGWFWCNVLQTANGKRQLVHIVPDAPGLWRSRDEAR